MVAPWETILSGALEELLKKRNHEEAEKGVQPVGTHSGNQSYSDSNQPTKSTFIQLCYRQKNPQNVKDCLQDKGPISRNSATMP